MNILSQKVSELEEILESSGVNYISKKGSLTKNESRVIANKDQKRIAVLILSQNEKDLKAYTVGLSDWLAAEANGMKTEDIMKNLTLVRMINIRHPQVAKLEGDVFAEVELESLEKYLKI